MCDEILDFEKGVAFSSRWGKSGYWDYGKIAFVSNLMKFRGMYVSQWGLLSYILVTEKILKCTSRFDQSHDI